MRPDWEGDMKVIVDIIELYISMGKFHRWATRVFEPSAALHLNQ